MISSSKDTLKMNSSPALFFKRNFGKWRQLFELLKDKWVEVPFKNGNIRTDMLLKLSDADLLKFWEDARSFVTEEGQFEHRGWYHLLYRDSFHGKKLMDVGSGIGIDGLTFAQSGAQVTFVDICSSNLEVIKRLAALLDVQKVKFHYMTDVRSLEPLDCDYDVVFAQGSLHHLPFDIVRSEARALLEHLPAGGRWIQLSYPKSRWIKEGSKPFDEWGVNTDGYGTPWSEWYDLEKLSALLHPARFDTLLSFEFCRGDFIWFDLLRKK